MNAPAKADGGGSDPNAADPDGPQSRGSKQFTARDGMRAVTELAYSWDDLSAFIELTAGGRRAPGFATIPAGTPVSWHYRSAIGHGTVKSVHKLGTRPGNTMYNISEHDHHVSATGSREKPVVVHSGQALTRTSAKSGGAGKAVKAPASREAELRSLAGRLAGSDSHTVRKAGRLVKHGADALARGDRKAAAVHLRAARTLARAHMRSTAGSRDLAGDRDDLMLVVDLTARPSPAAGLGGNVQTAYSWDDLAVLAGRYVELASANGHHVPGSDYEWKHNYVPLTHAAASSHFKGSVPKSWHAPSGRGAKAGGAGKASGVPSGPHPADRLTVASNPKAAAKGMSDGDLKSADSEFDRRAALLGKPGQVSKAHAAVRSELARRATPQHQYAHPETGQHEAAMSQAVREGDYDAALGHLKQMDKLEGQAGTAPGEGMRPAITKTVALVKGLRKDKVAEYKKIPKNREALAGKIEQDATHVITGIPATDERAKQVRGHMTAAATAVRSGNHDEAARHLSEAQQLADTNGKYGAPDMPILMGGTLPGAGTVAAKHAKEVSRMAANERDLQRYAPTVKTANAYDWGDLLSVIEFSARTAMLERTPAPIGKPGGPGLYHVKGLGHADYFQQVRNALMRRGVPEGRAHAMTWSILRRWASGAGKVHPEVRAAAAKAVAEEEAKAHSHAVTWDDVASVVGLAVPFNEALHPRAPSGQANGGQFAAGGQGSGPAQSQAKGQGKQPAKAPAQPKPTAHQLHIAHVAHVNGVSTQKAELMVTAQDDRQKAAGLIKQRDALEKALASAAGKTSSGQAGAKTSSGASKTKSTAPAAKTGTAPAKTSTAPAKTSTTAKSTASSKAKTASASTSTASASAPKAGSAAAVKTQIAQLNLQITNLLNQAQQAEAQAAKMQ
jgi:hypothetical protein